MCFFWLQDENSLSQFQNSISLVYQRGSELPEYKILTSFSDFADTYHLTSIPNSAIKAVDNMMKSSKITLIKQRYEVILKTKEFKPYYWPEQGTVDIITRSIGAETFITSQWFSLDDTESLSCYPQTYPRPLTRLDLGEYDLYKRYPDLTSTPYKYTEILSHVIREAEPALVLCLADGSGGCT